MKRRTIILGGAAAIGAAGAGALFWPHPHAVLAAKRFEWTGEDFLAGGTGELDSASLPVPVFRQLPNCLVTEAQTIGPCHANDAPVRFDVTEGRPGLPTRVAFRLVDAATCKPVPNADIEIWHTDARGIYSGAETDKMCTLDDKLALGGLACRGLQKTDADGVASLLTVYPGWYRGRTIHIHCRIVAGEKELLISQIYFDDSLTDIVHGQHPDYDSRPMRETRNSDDNLIPAEHSENYIFDFEKLAAGALSASITIGVAS
jgi:protocatechuate 3,4-dioxygenase beta subunit